MKSMTQRRSAVAVGAMGIGVAAMMLLSAVPTFAQDGGQGAPPPPGIGDGGGSQQGPDGPGMPPRGGGFGGGFGGQQGGPAGPPREVSVSRIPFDFLVSSLKLSGDQQGRIAVMLLEARDADQQMTPGQPGGPNPVSRKQRQAADAAVRQQLESFLSAGQKARLTNAIAAMRTLQGSGVPPVVVTKLNLTDEQIDGLAAAAPAEPTGEGGRDGQRPMAMQSMRKAIRTVLTSDQLTVVNKYLNRAMTAERNRIANEGQDGPDGPGGGPGGDNAGGPPPNGGFNGPGGGDNAGGPPPDGGPNTPPAP